MQQKTYENTEINYIDQERSSNVIMYDRQQPKKNSDDMIDNEQSYEKNIDDSMDNQAQEGNISKVVVMTIPLDVKYIQVISIEDELMDIVSTKTPTENSTRRGSRSCLL